MVQQYFFVIVIINLCVAIWVKLILSMLTYSVCLTLLVFSSMSLKSDGGGACVVLWSDEGHEYGGSEEGDKFTSGGCGLTTQTTRADQKPFR